MHEPGQSIIDSPVQGVPVAVVDIETTGLYPGADRLVELSVVRVEPGQPAQLVLNTLINPDRRVAATEIHGITDADVADAPRFRDVAGDLARALAGSVLAAYNVYFDVRFLEDEFGRVGLRAVPPYLCLMYLRPMLGLGKKCCLSEACRAHGIKHEGAHTAAFDALASAGLWHLYQRTMADRGVRTFRDLAGLRSYKFVESFVRPPLDATTAASLPSSQHLKARTPITLHAEAGREPRARATQVHEYWDALTAALADLELSDSEIADLQAKREELGLQVDELRALHGRAFAAMLAEALADSSITEDEWARLRRLHDCLRQLGWAPGM